ncbi:MAG: toll/interleukin-1 receptor domain-containing protein [Hydrogenophilaceae bacterium]|jgi:hypothetical protein|nr:toll/interleukin-1 receptor domain-containing protein [Hydrogenophilaceae bacterium]
MAEKPLIFVSHATVEAEMAEAVRAYLDGVTEKRLDWFVSSDGETLALGERWLDKIVDALKRARLLIVLASPRSLESPWIHFEAGAAWIRDCPVVPLCHSGMRKDLLDRPLLDLQGVDLLSVHDWNMLVRMTCEAAGMAVPPVRYDALFADINRIQDGYMFWDNLNRFTGEGLRGQGAEFAYLAEKGAIGAEENVARVTVGEPNGLDPDLGLRVPASREAMVEDMIEFFAAYDILRLERIGMLTYAGRDFVSLRAAKGAQFDVLRDPACAIAAEIEAAQKR